MKVRVVLLLKEGRQLLGIGFAFGFISLTIWCAQRLWQPPGFCKQPFGLLHGGASVALAETQGPAAGLAALDALSDDTRLAEYQPYWAARAGLLARIGDTAAADRAYECAIGLESDPAVRRFLQQRRALISN